MIRVDGVLEVVVVPVTVTLRGRFGEARSKGMRRVALDSLAAIQGRRRSILPGDWSDEGMVVRRRSPSPSMQRLGLLVEACS